MDDLPPINSWADVQAQKLTKAEQELIDAVKAGNLVWFGDTVPAAPTDAVLIRAPLLRYLILGGCAECRTPAKGVTVFGAWIAQELDLQNGTATGRIGLFHCHIDEKPQMLHLTVAALAISGSNLPEGLNAQGINVADSVFLRDVRAGDTITFSGAQITGQLCCDGATLENAWGHALNAQGISVGHDVFLSNLTARGLVTFSGAQIIGQLACVGATLINEHSIALLLQGANVQGGLVWRDIQSVNGIVDLNSAYFRNIVDDAASWGKCENINLIGLTYDQLHGAPNVPARLAWLEKGAKWGGQFHPQPYEQLAKVWRENGYLRDSAEISYHKEIEKGAAHRQQERANNQRLRPILRGIVDRAFRWSFGYGYKPTRSAYLLGAAVIIAAAIAEMAWRTGDFAPNSDIILVTEDWQTLATDTAHGRNAAAEWSAKAAKGQDYATFVSFYYAADVLIPIIDLGQAKAWAPSTNRGIWGWVLFWLNPLFVALGWFVTANWATAIASFIRRGE